MKYEVEQSRHVPDEWVVEAINHKGDGEIYATLFSGLLAKERAEEYAAWKNSGQRCCDCGTAKLPQEKPTDGLMDDGRYICGHCWEKVNLSGTVSE